MQLHNGLQYCGRNNNQTKQGDITAPEFVIDPRGHLRRYKGCNTNVYIPNSVQVICENAFGGCREIKLVIIPETVSVVHPRAFRECTVLEEVVIQNPTIKLYEDAFLDCQNLLRVYCLAENLYRTFGNAFRISNGEVQFVSRLTFLPLDAALMSQQAKPEDFTVNNKGYLYHYHGKDEEAHIPYSVCSILPNAFAKCNTIKRVVVPESVSVICRDAFHHCDALEEMVVLNSRIKIDENAIHDCPALTKVFSPFNYLENRQQHAFACCKGSDCERGIVEFLPYEI